jgi:hypothetical protein
MARKLKVGLTVTKLAALARLSAEIAPTAALLGHLDRCTVGIGSGQSEGGAGAEVALAASSAV